MESNKWILLGFFKKAYNIESKALLNQYKRK
uniref:Uncharacterized protein n=1 Tax=viral metagenome TaxID=1070528 RepID=A0A6C0H935_9ZZZZ